MSIVANLTVHQCDDCRQVAVVQTDEDYDSFAANWLTSVTLDFCPACRDKPGHKDEVEAERKLFAK